jgi:hypothetical protein
MIVKYIDVTSLILGNWLNIQTRLLDILTSLVPFRTTSQITISIVSQADVTSLIQGN